MGCARAAGADLGNDVWVGMWNSAKLYKLNGANGAVETTVNLTNKPYGLAIADDGTIWVTSRATNGTLMKVNPQTSAVSTYSTTIGPAGHYGIAIDPWGKIWIGAYETNALTRFDPVSSTWSGPYGSGGPTRGVAIKANYHPDTGALLGAHVFSGHEAGGCGNGVSYALLDASGNVYSSGIFAVPGASGPVGSAIDVDGYNWTVNYCGYSATKYSVSFAATSPYAPTVTTVGVGLGTLPIGAHPYTYSDMTGQALRNLAGVDGHYQHRWTGWSTGQTWWKAVNLAASLPGAPTAGQPDPITWLEVKWRSGDDATALNSAPWTSLTTVHGGTAMPLELAINPTTPRIGKYFDLWIDFRTTDPGGQVPELTGIGLVVYHL